MFLSAIATPSNSRLGDIEFNCNSFSPAKLKSLITDCAKAIDANDLTAAYTLLQSLRAQASPIGTAPQRLAYHLAEALAAKTVGTGSMLFNALASKQHPSIDEFFRMYRRAAEVLPTLGLSVFFTNQMILEETQSAKQVHIVDFGIGHGFRLLCLLKDLSERLGGPPCLRVTAVELPHHRYHDGVKGKDLRLRLERYAREVGIVNFKVHMIESDKWEELKPEDLKIRDHQYKDEVLIVTCIYRLRHLRHEPSGSRERFLVNVNRMKPSVFIHAALPYSCNSPMLVSRVNACLNYYSGGFESLEYTFKGEAPPERQMLEYGIGLDLLNALACDDTERVERPEGYRQWQYMFQRAGFKQLKLRPYVFVKATEMTETYQGSFKLVRRGNWLLVYWETNLLAAMTAWK